MPSQNDQTEKINPKLQLLKIGSLNINGLGDGGGLTKRRALDTVIVQERVAFVPMLKAQGASGLRLIM